MRRAIIALLLGIVAGYWIGYKDAYRGEKAIGSRIGIALGRAHPDQMRSERQKSTDQMRDAIRARAESAAGATLP